MNRFHEIAKVTLLTTFMAIALLSLTGIAYANTSTAPGQQWTVGTRVYNGHGDLVFHTTHATSADSITAEFNIPFSSYGFTDYLYTSPKSLPTLTEGETITATITISSGAQLEAGPWGGSDPVASPPAVVYLFIQANTPVSSQNQAPCMPPGYSLYNYWWAAATPVTDSTGALLGTTFTVTAQLSPGAWSGICGNAAQDPYFGQALASPTEVGLSFGGGYPSHFGANGIAYTSSSAPTFELVSYTVT